MKNKIKKITASLLTLLITFLTSTTANIVSAKIVNLTAQTTTQEYQMKNLNTDICKIINKYRKTKNAKSLKIKTALTKMAKVRAKECAVKYGHQRPNCKSLIDLAKSKNALKYTEFGEVLAKSSYIKNIDLADAIVKAWKRSPGHNRIIKARKYQYIGTSYYIKDDVLYVCSILAYVKR